jgi:hypothetical protein
MTSPYNIIHSEMNNLYKQILENGEDMKNKNIENTDTDTECLISKCPLEADHVTLKCGHKFNRYALHQSIYNQINIFNTFSATSLTQEEIQLLRQERKYEFFKCPYCKIIHFGAPPLSSSFRLPIFNKMLFVDAMQASNIKRECCAILKSGKNKGKKCTCPLTFVVFGADNGARIKYDFSNAVPPTVCGKHKKYAIAPSTL